MKHTHPEVLREVHAEFKKLHQAYPEKDGQTKWQLAQKYVRVQAQADTAILMLEMLGL